MKKISAVIVILLILIITSALIGCVDMSFLGMSDGVEDLTFSPIENQGRRDILIDEDGEWQTIYSTQEIDTVPLKAETETQAADSDTTMEVEEDKEEISRETRLKFLAAGDNIIHMTMIEDAKERAENGGFNFRDMYKHIEDDIKAADIAFINVETPIAGDEFPYTGYPNFNTPKENGIAIVDIGFDIINIANNHMLDKWERGYINHINFWENQDVLLLGGFKDEEDFETVRIYNRNGISIAFLTYTYGTNGMFLPAESKMVIPWLNAEVMERQIKAARSQADLLMVSVHWGDEDKFSANATQRNLVQMMVNNGVDVVIGHHPHVLQETLWIDRPDGGRTLTAYSLGNFISAQLYGKNMIGAMLSFDIVKAEDEKVRIENAEIVPVMTHMNENRRELQVYNFKDYTEELAKQHYCAINDPVFSYDYIMNLIKDTVLPEFLSNFYGGYIE